jgi:aldehyde dehydrogenase (NAD+)
MSEAASLLTPLGVAASAFAEGAIAVLSPIDGAVLGQARADDPASISAKIGRAEARFRQWRWVPAPRRGELVRLFGTELRAAKQGSAASSRSSPARFSPRAKARFRR